MQVILTPSSVADMFGPGLNGFTDVPPDKTQLSANWHNSVQQEIVNVILGQSIALDGLQFDQLKQAFDSYVFFGPEITGQLTIRSGAKLVVKNGGTLQCDAGSFAIFDAITCATLSSSGLATLDSADVTNTLTTNGSVVVNGTMSFVGAAAGALTSDTTAPCTWNGPMTINGVFTSAFRTKITSTTSLAANDMSVDANNNLRWRGNSGTKYVSVNNSGWVKGHGQVDAIAATTPSNLDTSTSVAPLATANLDVAASAWVSRAGAAGSVTVSLNQVGGIGQIGTSANYTVPQTGVGNPMLIVFSRTMTSANTTPRVYRFTVDGGGTNVTVTNARITVTPTS